MAWMSTLHLREKFASGLRCGTSSELRRLPPSKPSSMPMFATVCRRPEFGLRMRMRILLSNESSSSSSLSAGGRSAAHWNVMVFGDALRVTLSLLREFDTTSLPAAHVLSSYCCPQSVSRTGSSLTLTTKTACSRLSLWRLNAVSLTLRVIANASDTARCATGMSRLTSINHVGGVGVAR